MVTQHKEQTNLCISEMQGYFSTPGTMTGETEIMSHVDDLMSNSAENSEAGQNKGCRTCDGEN